jgi:hypothetical protein
VLVLGIAIHNDASSDTGLRERHEIAMSAQHKVSTWPVLAF